MVVKAKQLTDRSIYVYLPTVEMADEWKSLANKSKVSISKFVIEHVENSIKQEEDGGKEGFTSRVDLLKQLKEKDEEIGKLKQDNRLLKMLADNLDKELKRYRAEPFLQEKFEGVRAFDNELVQLLKKKRTIDSDRILHELGIKPKEIDLVKSVNKQLELLHSYGLAEPTVRGWKWTG